MSKISKINKETVINLYNKRLNDREIGEIFGLSRQRIHQIRTGYINPSIYIKPELLKIWNKRKRDAFPEEFKKVLEESNSPENLKILNKRKRRFLGIDFGEIEIKSGGRDFVREIVRMRDKYTCQSCGKIWEKGKRRFDVHHTDETIIGKVNTRNIPIKYDKENMDKLITYCHKCHINIHSNLTKYN